MHACILDRLKRGRENEELAKIESSMSIIQQQPYEINIKKQASVINGCSAETSKEYRLLERDILRKM